MSFPYTLDLSFGSEKATADSFGRVSFGASGGEGTKIPTNVDELNALVEAGKAFNLGKNIEKVENSMIADTYIWQTQENPDILGFVAVISGSTDPVTLSYEYDEEAGDSGAYEFIQPFGENGTGDIYEILK